MRARAPVATNPEPPARERIRTVLFVSNSGDLAGGGEYSLLDLVSALPRSRFRPVVLCHGGGALARQLRGLGVPVTVLEFPAWRRLAVLMIARTFHRLARIMTAHDVALVHCNATWRVALYVALVGRWRRVPVVWHVRVSDREGWKDRLLGRLMTRVVVNSDAVGGRFAGRARAKVYRIHNGVDVSRFAPRPAPTALRLRLGIPPGRPVVGSVGRFVAYKGYDHLLAAAAIVHAAHPDVHWVLVGDGDLRGALEAQCRRLGIERVVRFTGWEERVPDYLALFDVFVLPSVGEHFGRVLVEAMAMQTPVVATDAGGVPEILDAETGVLVPPAAPARLATAVIGLLQDPARAAGLGEAGRRRAVLEFSLARHVEAVEALYHSLIGETGGRV